MKLFPSLQKRYAKERFTAVQAQRLAQEIAFGPVVFQVSRLMLKFGIFRLLSDNREGLSLEQISQKTELSRYAAQVLLEASLTIGTVLVKDDQYILAKAGWFLLNDEMAQVNMNFNQDVNYKGLFHLEEALLNGRPEGLKELGNWPTIYEGLSDLPGQAQKSWFGFDHFYSDNSFDQALEIVFSHSPRTLLDVGGNTGRWATKCVQYNEKVEVTIMDISILSRAAQSMSAEGRLYIMETFWDRQKFETAAYCLTQISIYFTAMANGNSKMYHSDDMTRCIQESGLEIEEIYDNLGLGHSIVKCKLK